MTKRNSKNSAPAKKRADQYDDDGYNYLHYWSGRAYEHAAEERAIQRLLKNKHFKHAVDIGGGYGRLCLLLQNYADKVTLAEPSEAQLEIAAAYLKKYPKIARKKMQADDLKFADGSVDLITMIRVMHHLPDPSAEFTEISRVLAPNGYLILEMANYAHARNRLKHLVKRKPLSKQPVDIRSEENRRAEEIPFVNHHPKTVTRQLAHAGLKVERTLSVSNLRSPRLKKVLPRAFMLAAEQLLQPTLARTYFGPSVFFLVKKAK